MYAGFANIIMTLLFALIISLLWDYPIGIRWRKAVQCRTWWEWIRSGRHPRSRINRLEKDWCLAVDQQSATHEQPSSEITDDQQSIAL
jgi:hypothetical protein